jgi:hypothetical protein
MSRGKLKGTIADAGKDGTKMELRNGNEKAHY